MTWSRTAAFAGWALLTLAACSQDKLGAVPAKELLGGPGAPPPADQAPAPTCQTGGLMGRLCVPSTPTALADAEVYLYATDCHGTQSRYATRTSEDGDFSLAGLPAGTFTLHVESGPYDGQLQATVVAGEIERVESTGAGQPACTSAPPPRMAVIGGTYDSVEVLLEDLDIPHEVFEAFDSFFGPSPADELFSDLSRMREFDVILVNCGDLERGFLGYDYYTGNFDWNGLAYQNLRAFVAQGGSIYASDWAWPIAEGLSPTMVDFLGDETTGDGVMNGAQETITANVADQTLQLFLGAPTLQVQFDLAAWAVIDTVAPSVKPYVTGSIQAYTSAYSDDKVALANRPLLVGFRPFSGGGYVIYTTFHYHSQPSAQMLDVLRFLIFQL